MQGAFTLEALRRVVRASDGASFRVDLAGERNQLLDRAVEAATNALALTEYKLTFVRRKQCVHYHDYSSTLILRSISRYLARRFRIVIPNRDRVIQAVIEAMSDATPFYVIRRDISSFYENIPFEPLRERLLYDTALPRSVRTHLRSFFNSHCLDTSCGLPRGVGLSTILVELAMQDFDRAVRSIPGVYRYFRYSDDILIFAYKDPAIIANHMATVLPQPMRFNPKKSTSHNFAHAPSPDETDAFEYLGYRFSAKRCGPTKRMSSREVQVRISDDKIKRIKSRLVLTIKSFLARPNKQLLAQRLRFLSGNYKISRTAGFFARESKFVYSGIYYNYKRCGTYGGGGFSQTPRTELMSLDWFFHNLLDGPRSRYAKKLRTMLTVEDLKQLRRISFHKGYTNHLMVEVSRPKFSEIRSIWRNQ